MAKLRLFSSFRELLFLALHPMLLFRRCLSEETLDRDPFSQFARWYEAAQRSTFSEFPSAMCLSTVSAEGRPEGRMVLLKDFDSNGFVFYTNLESDKARSLASTPYAALTFYWGDLQRQVRIEGKVVPVSAEAADAYFATRPRRSQIGAWASLQSRPLETRALLEARVKEYELKFEGKSIPRPPFWSGFLVIPDRFEFWQLRLNRLHDRFAFSREDEGGAWKVERLFP